MKKKLLFLMFIYTAILIGDLHAQVVSTFAGSTNCGYLDGIGTATAFGSPTGVEVDLAGNIYVDDTGNMLIRKITSSADVSTFAGTYGSPGSANGAGTAASFNYPAGLAIDNSGNIYIADSGNNLIRKITSGGLVTTFAGSGSVGSTNGIGTAASFNVPKDVALDASGNVYVADWNNNRIRKITPTGVVTTLAGSGSSGSVNGIGTAASFNLPYGIAVDASGNVYVSDQSNHIVRKITPAGVVSTFAGSGSQGSVDGTGTAASFSTPSGIAVDASGNVYVSDEGNHLIRKISPLGVVTTLAGSGVAGSADGIGTAASFFSPTSITIDASNNLYVADPQTCLIRKITMTITAVEELTLVSDIKLYPIPANQTLTLALTLESESDLKLELISMSGIKVASTEASYGAGFHELSLSVVTLASGIYVANVYSNRQVKSQRVLVE